VAYLFALILIICGGLKWSLQAQTIGAIVGGISASPTSVSPSSMFWNPAIIGAVNSNQFESNLTLLGGWLIYDRQGTDPNTGAGFGSSAAFGLAPNLFLAAVSPLGTENFRFAYGTYLPSGLMADFDEEGSQHYDLINGMLIPWHHQFTAAWKATPELTLAVSGIGSIAFFRTELDVDMGNLMRTVLNSKDIPSEHPALEGRAKVPLAWTPGFGAAAGIYWRPSYQISAGFSIFSPITYSFSGKLKLRTPEMASLVGAGLPALGIDDTIENGIEANSSLPAFAQMGVRYQPFGYWIQEYFGRYTISSLERSLSIQVKESPIQELQNLNIDGEPLNDSFLLATTQTFPLWQRLTPGLYFSYYKNSAKERYLAVSRVDFDSLMAGTFVKYQWGRSLQLGLEYAHTFIFERSPSETMKSHTSRFFESPPSAGNYRAGFDRAGLTVKYAF